VLEAGTAVPDVQVWTGPRDEPSSLREVLGTGLALLCFYLWDWSPTWTNELHLLRDRSDDLAAAGIRPFGISRDSPWSHRAWADTLGVDVPLLSDWNGEAIRAFDVAIEPMGMTDVAMRSAFLIENGQTIVAAWLLGRELPDIDAVIEAARP
jgi:glutaredoxin-dependent peroxiredoxin